MALNFRQIQATSGAFEVAKWLVEELRIQRIQLKGSGMIFHDTPNSWMVYFHGKIPSMN
jgi:hypothetical protein